MTSQSRRENMSPRLLRVAERAKRDPNGAILSLASLIDEPALERAYNRIRKNAAVGVDGVSKEQYGQNLGENLRELHERIRAKRYRHQAIRRVHIPKERGKTRPIGVSTIEDKVVQNALREVLEVIYEPVFHDSSYGFRPRRGAHDALRSLNRMIFEREVNWIIEADIQSYFDSIDRTKLKEMLRLRIADESMMRLIGKCPMLGSSTARSTPSRTRGRCRARRSRRFLATYIYTTCWMSGSRPKCDHDFVGACVSSVMRMTLRSASSAKTTRGV
jgi:RNA-directed DNA polymerase